MFDHMISTRQSYALGPILVGADGKTSFTRKIYLESKDVKTERTHQ
jgi:hypothetical protein